MKTLLSVLRGDTPERSTDELIHDSSVFRFLSIRRLLPVLTACAVVFTIVLLLATARLMVGSGEMSALDQRYAVFFGLLVPAALAVGLALRLGMPSAESLKAERRQERIASEILRQRQKIADANAHAARIEAQAHARRSGEIMDKNLPKSLAKRETAGHDALDYLVDRRRGIEKAMAKQTALGLGPLYGDESREQRATAARSLFQDPRKAPGRPERYETEKPAAATIKRVA